MDDELLRQQFQSLATLIEGVKESLEREIVTVKERIDRMDVRLGKIAAGALYRTDAHSFNHRDQIGFGDPLIGR